MGDWKEFLGIKKPKSYLEIVENDFPKTRFLYTTSEHETEAETFLGTFGVSYIKQNANVEGVTEYLLNLTNDFYQTLAGRVGNNQYFLISPTRKSDFGTLYTTNNMMSVYSAVTSGTFTTTYNTNGLATIDMNSATYSGIQGQNGTLTIIYSLNRSIGTNYNINIAFSDHHYVGNTSYEISVSQDNTNWTSIGTYSASSGDHNQTDTWTNIVSGVKFIKLYLAENYTDVNHKTDTNILVFEIWISKLS